MTMMKPDLTIIGHRLKIARMIKGMTIREVSEETGITQATISRLERGLHQPALYTVTKIAYAVDLPLIDLFREGETQ